MDAAVIEDDAHALLAAAHREEAKEERRLGERRVNLPKVACPKCGEWDSIVKEGRPDPRGYRRIRECGKCHVRYTTIERAA